MFSPRDIYGTDSPILSRLGLARSLLGIVIIGGAVLAQSPRHAVVLPEYIAAQGFSNLFAATVIMLGAGLLLLAGTAAGQRRAAARSLRRPLVTLGAALLVLIGFVVGVDQLVDRGDAWLDTRDYQPWHTAVDIVMLVAIVWTVIFVLVSCVLVVRHVFNAADGHPLLPPVIVIPVAWAALVIPVVGPERYWFLGALEQLGSDVELPVPPSLLLIFAVSGAVTVTGLAGWELVSLRRRGIRFTSGWR